MSMKKHLLLLFSLSLTLAVSVHLPAQENPAAKTVSTDSKPFRILTSGKKITIQSKQNLKTVIVWTSNGHRLVEQKDINSNSYSFNITIPDKIFFVRVDMEDGKMYTQKLGVQ